MRSSGKPDLGLIGYGRFGRLAARHLGRWFRVAVADRRAVRGRGIRRARLAEVARLPVVVLAVPVNQLRPVLRSIAPHLRPGALVIDVCAVKGEPMRWMRELLPPHASFIGTHPLFGPDSAARSVRGHTVVVCPGRVGARTLGTFLRLVRQEGVRVVVTTPERHDRIIARTLFLPQFIGRASGLLAEAPDALQTPSSRKLLDVVTSATHDSEELLRDIYLHSPFARRAVREFAAQTQELLRRLGK